tara:strand:- start:270 stop:587 length:318 start_codon:yes stop_codon:yes gene_type:complete
MIAQTPKPPYYAVIFTSYLVENTEEYQQISLELEQLAEKQDGFLGFEAARDGMGLFISYWKDEEVIREWKKEISHQMAQKRGREEWYEKFHVRIAKVERAYGFER